MRRFTLNEGLMILKANHGLMISLALVVSVSLILGLISWIMNSQGASLRPIVFLGVLMWVVIVPQLVGHLVLARKPVVKEPKAQGALSPKVEEVGTGMALDLDGGRIRDVVRVMGGGVKSDAVQDVRMMFAEVFKGAQAAELGVTEQGETILVAQFDDEKGVWSAAREYEQRYQLAEVEGQLETGRRGRAGLSGQCTEILARGRVLWVWTAAHFQAIAERRRVALGGETEVTDLERVRLRHQEWLRQERDAEGAAKSMPVASEGEPLIPALQPLQAFFKPWSVKITGMLALGLVYVLLFFKGATWAGSTPAVAGVRPVSQSELEQRLESINGLDVPFRVERGEKTNEWWVTWRYADAKWVDMARAHGLRRTFKIHLVLDAKSKIIRSTDHVTSFDWSAGARGVSGEWKRISGVMFFFWEHHRVLGLQLDESGRPKPRLSYAYTFKLQELKAPLVEVTTKSGWDWRPTPWQAPGKLRWLTE